MRRLIIFKIRAAAWFLPLLAVAVACSGPADGRTELSSPEPTATRFVFPPTYTPTEPGPPTETPTPRASRTPSPTDTPAPTLEPSATPLFEIRLAAAGDLPFVAASLLYAAGGEVRVWDALTLDTYPLDSDLPSGSLEIAISEGGLVIAGIEKSADGFSIWVYNRFSAETIYTDVLPGDELLDLTISPDGSLLTVIVRETVTSDAAPPAPSPMPSPTPAEGDQTPTPAPTATMTQPPPVKTETRIYSVDLLDGNTPQEVADCAGECSPVIWSRLSDLYLWGDGSGLWRMSRAGEGPVRLLEPFLVGVSGGNQQNDSFRPIEISPSGRFAVVQKGLTEGSILAAVDLTTGLIENLPGTGEYTGSKTGFAWLFGDILTIARPGVARLELMPAIELWAIDPAGDAITFNLFARHILSNRYDVSPDAPKQLPDGRLGYTLNSYRDGSDPFVNGLFLMDLATGNGFQVNYLPILQAESVDWLPDGLGALITTPSRMLFVPVGFGQIYSMTAFLGSSACCLTWLP